MYILFVTCFCLWCTADFSTPLSTFLKWNQQLSRRHHVTGPGLFNQLPHCDWSCALLPSFPTCRLQKTVVNILTFVYTYIWWSLMMPSSKWDCYTHFVTDPGSPRRPPERLQQCGSQLHLSLLFSLFLSLLEVTIKNYFSSTFFVLKVAGFCFLKKLK